VWRVNSLSDSEKAEDLVETGFVSAGKTAFGTGSQ
jgi:hypothetical protein